LETERIRFDRRMDELVRHVVSQDIGTPEFRTEYVKAANLLKRVADYDPELASELLLTIWMCAYHFAIGVTPKIFRR
jgi:hypothetical protein